MTTPAITSPRHLLHQAWVVLEMIKFQHTVFALPFAFVGLLLAADGLPSVRLSFWVVLACVTARTAAMSFNRWADAAIDAKNPRTSARAIPAGHLSARFVLVFALISAVAFVACAAMINPLAFVLSPVALLILLGYSYTKRFTALAHLVLGLALALAPIGAWIAVRGTISLSPLLLGLGVMLWTAGFDLLYACQDTDFDKSAGLFSVPARYGPRHTLRLSRLLHLMAVVSLTLVGVVSQCGAAYYAGIAAAGALLVAEHIAVDPTDPRKINLVFFTINSWVGMAVLAGTIADTLLFR